MVMPSDNPDPALALALALAQRAMTKPPEARAAYIDQESRGDVALANRARRLLEQHDAQTIAGDEPAAHSSQPDPDPMATRVRGRKIGRYTVMDVLGEGGMGTVYLAEQDSPKRTVALKVIRPGLITRSLLRRFEVESGVLGRLQHPGIARVYEAGTAVVDGSDIPYFAMELVRGQPLTLYAEARGLDVRQRLALMALVCDAVQHAHTRGVIHRDLKPGNILVEEADDADTTGPLSHATTAGDGHASRFGIAAQPKILDFGIARVTDGDVQPVTVQTDVGQLIGTLPYMSPEQVAGNTAELDTRSDVYTLGVILFELLAGRLPHDVSKRTIPEAVRIIGAEPPTRLAWLKKELRGEVQTIVEKAIEKDRARRYQSARELADDIRRFLRDEPITARPAGAAYRFSKFAKRNKGLVGGLATAAAILALGAVGVGWQAARATAGWSKAEQNLAIALEAQKRAETEAENARSVSDFIAGMLTSVDPEVAVGREVTARELFDSAVAGLETGPKRPPAVESTIRSAVSQSYRGIGKADLAIPHARRVLDLALHHDGPESRQAYEAGRNLVIVLADAGKFDEAETLARAAVQRESTRTQPDETRLAEVKSDLARVAQEIGKVIESVTLLEEALPTLERRLGPEHKQTLSSRNNLATCYKAVGRLQDAERVQREVYDAYLRMHPPEHPLVLSSRNNLATLLERLGKANEAAELFRATLAARERVLGPAHVSTANTRLNLGVCLAGQGKPGEAEPLIRSALESLRSQLGMEHPRTLIALGNLAYVLEDLTRLDEAETLYRQVVEIRSRGARGAADPEVWGALNNLAMLLLTAGKLDEARSQFQELLVACEQSLPADHYVVAIFRNNYGECLTKLNDFPAAERALLDSRKVLVDKLGPNHARTRKADARLAALYEAMGKPDLADLYRRTSDSSK